MFTQQVDAVALSSVETDTKHILSNGSHSGPTPYPLAGKPRRQQHRFVASLNSQAISLIVCDQTNHFSFVVLVNLLFAIHNKILDHGIHNSVYIAAKPSQSPKKALIRRARTLCYSAFEKTTALTLYGEPLQKAQGKCGEQTSKHGITTPRNTSGS
jgi:hypothetical protein